MSPGIRFTARREQPMLHIKDLDVSIASVGILRGVNMAVPTGKFIGLIGRNGAGKTTLMRSIMGILRPRHGSILFDGAPVGKESPVHQRARNGMGYMPEDRRLVPSLTVEENVLIPAWSAGIADPRKQLADIYKMIP